MKNRWCVLFGVVACVLAVCVGGRCDDQSMADLRIVKARLVELALAPSRQPREAGRGTDSRGPRGDDPTAIERLMTSLRPDGSWGDLGYANSTVKDLAHGTLGGWGSTSSHLSRMANMARAYRTPGSRWHDDEQLRDKVLLALDYWLRNDFRNASWWQDQIATQERLADTLLLMDQRLSPEQRAASVKIMQRSQIGQWTGANLLWMAGNQIVRGCIAGQLEPVADAYRRIAGEIRIAGGSDDGIKADNSFFQHGEQLYSGGYGMSFTDSCARLAYVARGTRFALPPEQVKVLTDFVLEGQRWMVWGSTFDYNAVGRELCRRNKDARALRQPCLRLQSVCPERSGEFASFAQCLEDDSTGGPVGNRHFWRGDIMVHRREAFYASVHMLSPRTVSSECIRGEGLCLQHLADGVTLLYRDGHEYVNIFPVWDWRRLPGITCLHSSGPLVPPELLVPPENPTREQGDQFAIRLNKAVGSRGTRDFVGGVSDGVCGLAAMDFVRGPLLAEKAWFFFDREIVCLGAGIACAADDPVLTSVNQCLLRGPVALSDGRQSTTVERGRRDLGGMCWVHHDGIGYVFPEKTNVVLAAEQQRGDWHDLVLSHRSEPAAADVFSLWIDHGKQVSAGQYDYVIVPGIESAGLEAYAKARAVRVLRNTPALQAVRHDELKLMMGAFYEPGTIGSGNLEISVDRPCLLLVREKSGSLVLAVSNPENRPLTVQIEVNRHLEGDGCQWMGDRKLSRVVVELPAGEDAGKSVVRRLVIIK